MKKFKYGFTLFEVLITVSIVAIFVAACSNVFTQRHKARISLPAHGRYECYYNGGSLTEAYYSENVLTNTRTVSECKFSPGKIAAYLIVQAVGPGGSGNATYGGTAGTYSKIFLNNTAHTLKLQPGKEPPQPTLIYDKGSNGQNLNLEIVRAEAGHTSGSGGGALHITGCSFMYPIYSVQGFTPTCDIEESSSKININIATKNATTAADIDANTLLAYNKYTFSDLTAGAVVDNSTNLATFSIMLCKKDEEWTHVGCSASEVKEYGKLILSIDENLTGNRAISPLTYYLRGLGASSSGLAALNPGPGDGGAKNQRGGTGAVLIAW